MKASAGIGLLSALGLLGACSSSVDVMLGSDGEGAAGPTSNTGASGGAGLGSSGGSGPVTPPACTAGSELAVVAPAESGPSFIALDQTHVYWSTESAIRRAPHGGGPADTLTDGQPIPMGLTVDSDFVYWASHNDPSIRRVPKAGGAVVELVSDIESGGAYAMVAVDETHVYARGGCEEIVRIPKTGGAAQLVVSIEGCIGGIAIDADSVYFVVDYQGGAIASVPKSGGAPHMLVSAEVAAAGGYTGAAPGIAVDAERVSWMSSSTGRVLTVPKQGGEVTVLGTGILMGQDVVSDGTHVYWSEVNAMRMVGVVGGNVVTLVESPQLMPMSLALGDDYAYFTNYITTGPVMRVCR